MYFVCDVNFSLASGPVEYMGQVGFLTDPYSTLVVFTNITMMAYSRQFSSKKWLIFDPNSLIR